MAEKSSKSAIILGSAVVSAIVSIGYNHFFVSRKDLLERELNFVSTLNTVLNQQTEKDELGRLTFVTNVLHPLYGDDPEFSVVIQYLMRAKSTTSEEAAGKLGNTLDLVLTRNSAPVASAAILDSLEQKSLIPTDYTVESLRDGLFSAYRRQLSDKLVAEINDGNTGLSEKLIDSIIQNDPKREYRVNLYIAYTLARTANWTASEESRLKLADLANSENYGDSTFKQHLDEALRRYDP